MVGAGIGGTAAAYYLRQEFGAAVKIDVFEPDAVGGRLATVKVGDYEYENGGTVIHPLNLHMKNFIDKLGEIHISWIKLNSPQIHVVCIFEYDSCEYLGLSARKNVPSKMAIFDGKELVFEESDWFIVNFLRMLWRYGFNFIRMQMWVESILDKFMR